MRMLVFFDLPVTTVNERKIATQFRKFLLKDGYHDEVPEILRQLIISYQKI